MLVRAPRVLLAKVGLDGHDRGIRVVARGLRDAGLHVIYAGLWQTPEAVVQAVLDEDADWLGLSLLSGAHMTLVPRVIDLLRQRSLERVGVVVGGIIPREDVPRLTGQGVAAIFGPGTSIPEIVEYLGGEPSGPSEPATNWTYLVERFRRRDRLALTQLLSLASRGEVPEGVLAGLSPAPPGRTVAFTGGGGVGKSSLIGRLVERRRSTDEPVAVLCCDPQSPLTGGALLGDRVRIARPTEDEGLFLRSLATPGGQQGIASHLGLMARLLRAFGFGTVIVETVGAGQGDTAIREAADVLVVLLQPQTGDELQWEKAGQLEVADVVVVNKADLPEADRTHAEVRDLLNLPGAREVPVLKASAARREGLDELWDAIQRAAPDS